MLNQIQIIGNLGQDPDLNESGTSKYARFSVATSESYKDLSGEWQTKTTWHNVQAWASQYRDLASKAMKLRKGNKVYVCGSMKSYKSKEGVTYWSIKATDIKRLDKPQDQPQDQAPAAQQQSANDSWGQPQSTNSWGQSAEKAWGQQ